MLLADPDLDFEAGLKRMENVYYFRGSEMDAADLERVEVRVHCSLTRTIITQSEIHYTTHTQCSALCVFTALTSVALQCSADCAAN